MSSRAPLSPAAHAGAGFVPHGPGHSLPVARARIGPNAITRVHEALGHAVDEATTTRVFALAGLEDCLGHMPQSMVPEQDVSTLQAAVPAVLGAARARRVLREAGALTADYLLAHRIPRAAQWLMRALPGTAGSALLFAVMRRHAWTFAGSGQFSVEAGPVLCVTGCPLCRQRRAEVPVCDYYAACFEGLLRALIWPQVQVVEVECIAAGGAACRFEVHR